ncbi:DUF4298 domain-containing protein [Peptoniphilus sp. KCTC 25270]|uniref:DUF4298 domain-containing protein n=1 Tax=Peptoniphilus sp. KCTC 25270 TaxID=2897414 RepID=UPI001E38AE90|nr:DUF4298 domain-containing protein [Peptoniphilus sp. KCTC 25270]MCD1148033.1 DUF4298 domain-containing protein [Peptoniphilus sp. KCTC 25270]
MNQILRIKEMETILDNHSKAVEEMELALENFAQAQKAYQVLREYYGSEEFFQDVEDSNCGAIPSDVKCGVLSEDAVFDLIGDNHHLAIEMLELATEILKNH